MPTVPRAETLHLDLSILPLLRLILQKPLRGSDLSRVHLLVHPIELRIDDLELRLRSIDPALGIRLSVDRSGTAVPILTVFAEFSPKPEGANGILDRVGRIVRVLKQGAAQR